ncbi:hypothetical protein [Caballeronia sp. PC1]|uniref:hypothetical protein n=1 Tax=Caballeronia sp. PC1 TaxID=2906765 RepID=UPI001F40DE06|nr:hypothetical protein [Caballeronia sp. PC1]MCE4544710.1 hypothetical protein [Caballeronia sp. PC1]
MAQLMFRGQRERMKALDGDLRADALDMRDSPLGIPSGLVAEGGQLGDARLERRIAHIDHSILDRLIESGELGIGLRRPTLHLGDVLAALRHPFLTPGDKLVHQHFKPSGIEQPLLQMLDHGLVQPVHRQRDAGQPVFPFVALVAQV